MGTTFACVNEELVDDSQAALKISDLAIQRGYGVFDFFRTVDGKPLFLSDHLARLARSAAALHLPLPDEAVLIERMKRVVERNQLPESGVRITVTGGYSTDGYTIAAPNVVISERPLRQDSALRSRGVRLMTHSHQRQLPFAKTLDYLMAVCLQPILKSRNVEDVLYEHNGIVTECPRSNFFLVTKDGALATPTHNILEGVVRKQVLSLAESAMPVERRDIHLREFTSAREAFITSTTKGVMPVVAIDNHPIGTGKPDEITRALSNRLDDRIREVLNSAHWSIQP